MRQAMGILGAVLLLQAAWGSPSEAVAELEVLQGLRFWFRADSGITRDAAGLVSAWASRSEPAGSAYQTMVSESRPRLEEGAVNGRPALRFDGKDDFLYADLGALSSPLTLFSVVRFEQSSQGDDDFEYILSLGGILRAGGHIGLSRWGSKRPDDPNRNKYYSVYDSINHVDLFGPVLPGRVFLLMAAVHDVTPPRHLFYLNGEQQEVIDGPRGISLRGGFTIGKLDHPWRFHHLDGQIAEILVYSRALPDHERSQVEEYLMKRYALGRPQGQGKRDE